MRILVLSGSVSAARLARRRHLLAELLERAAALLERRQRLRHRLGVATVAVVAALVVVGGVGGVERLEIRRDAPVDVELALDDAVV
ncbi:MAG: hypothetical protein U5K43_10365 [Halofilum sp. (in: g-proteobacteria)]|nr:hypothetical protein [Halofilum sp. (in: g-proteobacteria)]